ncbi:MAG: DUF488 domain-containing protein [Phycisphaerales bacterium]|nr:DUF488 domain-containing protein [Phycisphaerales bacterium]
MIERILTIGAYGYNADTFAKALQSADVDLFVDIRARRGMRGSAYAFANASRLITTLAGVGIRYVAAKEVAPTQVVRDAQRLADVDAGIAKRARSQLSDAFIAAYRDQCLGHFDSRRFIDRYIDGAKRPVLFCVEREPAACHRSLLAERLSIDLGVPVENIRPCELSL